MNRHLFAALLLVLFADIVQAGDSPGVVSVRQPLTRLVRRVEVEETCGVRGVAACTGFVGQRIDCDCEESDSGWSLRAHAQFIPVIILSDATWASHEREHIADVREALEAHVYLLRKLHFGSVQECRQEADRQSAGFGSLMDRFKLESNAARHPRFARLLEAK